MKKVILLFASMLSLFFTNAQWKQTNGPCGGQIYVLTYSGNNIYAGTDVGGIYLSSNSGKSWSSIGLHEYYIRCILVNGNNIYAGSENPYWNTNLLNNKGGVFHSSNNGNTWEKIDNGIENKSVTALAFDGVNSFAGTDGNGIYLSTNNGNSWKAVNKGITNFRISSLVINGGSVLAGTDGGIFRTDDSGNNWKPVVSGLNSITITSMAISKGNIFSGTYGGVSLSTDNGDSWTNIGSFPSNTFSVAAYGDSVYTGTYGSGIYFSSDMGGTWKNITNGLYKRADKFILAIATNGVNLFAGTKGDGVYSSLDYDSWTKTSNGLTSSDIRAITVRDSKLFVATVDMGIAMSSDFGDNWTEINNGVDPDFEIWSLGSNGQKVYAGIGNNGVFVTDNNGGSWITMNNGLGTKTPYTFLAIDNDLFTGTLWGIWLFLNNDGYFHNSYDCNDCSLRDMFMSGNDIYAGTSTGLLKSSDYGTSWMKMLNDSDIHSISTVGANLVISTYPGGVILSEDSGKTWKNTGLTGTVTTQLCSSGNIIFAATNEGVFLSKDYGLSWKPVNDGLKNLEVYRIAVMGDELYAGTSGSGVWKRPLWEINGIEEISNNKGFSIYPNPLTSSFIIQLNTSVIGQAEIFIYDLLGKEIIEKKINCNRIEIENGNLENGIYFVRLKNNEGEYIQKIVIQ